MFNKNNINLFVAIGLILLAIASRFMPLAPNFSPIMAVALFSGMIFANKKIALLIPIVALFISDLFIGLHFTMLSVYLSFGIITLLGMRIKKANILNVLGTSIFGAIVFFVLTNFAVWVAGWYGYTLEGLVLCYQLAIPFFRATLESAILYSALLFGGFYLIERFALNPIVVK